MSVPLNVEISYVLLLSVNNSKNNNEARVDVKASENKREFSITFPEGNTVLAATSLVVPVKITFKCAVPLSAQIKVSHQTI